MQKMGSTWWINWEGTHRADYLFSSQSFVLHTVFLPPSLSLYLWLSVSWEIITLTAEARLQKQKRGESVFPLSKRKCGEGMKINPYVCVDTNLTHIQSDAVQLRSSGGSNLHNQLNFPSFLFPNSEAPGKWIIFMSQPITHLVNSFVNLPCLPFHSSALVVSQSKEKGS